MHAKKLPTILDLLTQNPAASVTVSSQCRMGWCTQCACDKTRVKELFGETQYRSEPSVPPVDGKILTCLSVQTKTSETFDMLTAYFGHTPPQVRVQKQGFILARLPRPSEIGAVIKTLVVSQGRLIVGQRSNITCQDVIVRNPVQVAPDKYTEILASREAFMRSYNRLPAVDSSYERFDESNAVPAYVITNELAAAWRKDPDGRMYFRQGKETYEVSVGTVITVNGVAITDDLAKKVHIQPASDATYRADPELRFGR